MDSEQLRLDPEASLPFRLRLRVGDATPAEMPHRIADAVSQLRERGGAVARRSERVADLVAALGARGWRLVGDEVVDGARETVSTSGFAALGGEPLPPAIAVARDARPEEIAADLAAAFGSEAQEIPAETTVNLDGYDLPVRLAGDSMALVYSLHTYLETFSIRG